MSRIVFGAVKFCLSATAIAALATVAAAAPIVNNQVSGSAGTYNANISNSDLINNLTGTYTGFINTGGATEAHMTNGLPGNSSLNQISWIGDSGATAEYNLGAGTYGLGYAITSINSIAEWGSADFRNQLYDVYVKYLGQANFEPTPLFSVDNRPAQSGGSGAGGSTQSTITDSTGILASGIEAIRFEFGDAASNFANSTTFTEIDVFGFAVAPPPPPIPEPSALAAVGGTVALLALRRKRGRRG